MFMKITQLVVVSTFLTLASAAFAECEYPSRVEIPDGATSDKDAMLAGQEAVKAYVADMEAYLDCIVTEEKTARMDMDDLQPEEEQQREEMLNKKYNAAVAEMETVAARFNAEVQAYRGKSGEN